jgi:hypothetical protein
MGYNTTVPLDPLCAGVVPVIYWELIEIFFFSLGLNCAVSGAVVADIPSQIKYMKAHLDTTYLAVRDQWKLLTIFIGANDACGCQHADNQPDQWEDKVISLKKI